MTSPANLTVVPEPEPRPLMTPKQVAQRLAVSVSMVRKLTVLGQLEAVYLGRLPRYEAASVERLLERQRGGR
jgi:excisionase family DNA binding protein